MKFVSWNVNGLRAVLGKGFKDIMLGFDADAFCVQETKMQPEQMTHDLEGGYELFWNSAERKGYSGTATATRIRPQAVECGCFDNEGRILTLDLGPLYLVNVYSPNSQGELVRLPYRLEWEARFRDCGFVDTFRLLHPDDTGAYSWWSYRMRARERNVGWRIDYFLVSSRLAPRVLAADIHADILGSDHCPVSLTLDL